MNKTISVITADIMDQQLRLHIENTYGLEDAKATGNMLVDSDRFAFVYILEVNGEYNYLLLEEKFWSNIRKAKDQNLDVILTNRTNELVLSHFIDEMNYLTENIKGNSNYGEEMVEKVEKTF
jgi:hypothetical protein